MCVIASRSAVRLRVVLSVPAATVCAMTAVPPCRVYELRQYTLRPHAGDGFEALFDAELVDTQEATGMRVLGQFRDLDRPDAFVWVRGFADMTARREALQAFYGGPVWAAHRDVANNMMLDSDDVLLLETAQQGPALDASVEARSPGGRGTAPASLLMVEVCPLAQRDTENYLQRYQHAIAPLLVSAGARPLPALRTLHAANTFPRLPVREGEHFAVTLTAFAYRAAAAALVHDPIYQAAAATLDPLASGPIQRLRLAPTARSALR